LGQAEEYLIPSKIRVPTTESAGGKIKQREIAGCEVGLRKGVIAGSERTGNRGQIKQSILFDHRKVLVAGGRLMVKFLSTEAAIVAIAPWVAGLYAKVLFMTAREAVSKAAGSVT